MGKAAAWSRAVSHRLIIRSTVHEGSIARQARYRCAAFALLQDHSASSEEQNAAIQTKKKKGKKNEQPEELEAFTINYLQLLL